MKNLGISSRFFITAEPLTAISNRLIRRSRNTSSLEVLSGELIGSLTDDRSPVPSAPTSFLGFVYSGSAHHVTSK